MRIKKFTKEGKTFMKSIEEKTAEEIIEELQRRPNENRNLSGLQEEKENWMEKEKTFDKTFQNRKSSSALRLHMPGMP